MQLITLLSFTSLAGLALATPMSDQTLLNEGACRQKNPKLAQAINEFCSNTNLHVPSNYALNGIAVGDEMAWIWPTPGCPSAYVPQKYCYSQFFSLCAADSEKGYNLGKYGVPGQTTCQAWFLNDRARHAVECRIMGGCD